MHGYPDSLSSFPFSEWSSRQGGAEQRATRLAPPKRFAHNGRSTEAVRRRGADDNQDGQITTDELFAYPLRTLPGASKQKQHPVRNGDVSSRSGS